MMVLEVSETFLSLQGEGIFVGQPCFFIRLSGCNLRCSYCDTAYAWEKGEELSRQELVARWKASRVRLVQLTGGEPLLQRPVYDLMAELANLGAKVLLETNGSLSLSDVPKYVSKSVDWKTPGSGSNASWVPENLRYLSRNDAIKFVITNREDFEFARSKTLRHGLQNFTNVYFSPAWGMMDIGELAQWIIEDRLPVRLGFQLHKIIWGNVRGK